MLELSIKADVKRIERELSRLAYRQAPFAAALALTELARLVQQEEVKAMTEVLDRPTPFTLRSVGMRGARKDDLEARVFVKDIAAAYLEPFEFGGVHSLGAKRALLVPKQIGVNQYGNLPRGTLARLKGRSNIFIGSVTFKQSGQTVSGVWQRPVNGGRRGGGSGTKGNTQNQIGGSRTGLKLLIRFEDPQPVHQRLEYRERAKRVVAANFNRVFGQALRRAIATGK